MKQGKDTEGFPEKPWTIASTENTGRGRCYQALNLVTGERGPLRTAYWSAELDIEQMSKPMAEPWGV